MKKLAVALIFLVLLLLVIPGAVGLVAENQFRKLSSNLDTESTGLKLIVEDYRRGWFSSRAQYRLSPEYPELEGYLRQGFDSFPGWPSVVIEAEIIHGPLLLGALGRDDGSRAPAIAQSFDDISVSSGNGELIRLPARMTTRLGFFGHYSNEIKVAPFTHEFSDSGEPGRLNWDGMRLTTHFGPALDEVTLSGQVGAIEIRSGAFHFRAGPAQLRSQQARGEYGLWTGDVVLNWEGVRIDDPERFFFIENISLETSSSITGGLFGQRISASISGLGMADWKAGPGKLQMSLERANAQALSELTAYLGEVASQGGDAGPSAVLPMVFPQLQALLAGGPQLALRDLSLETQEGMASLNIHLDFPESSPEAAFGFMLGLEGSARLRLPGGLMDKLVILDPEGAASVQMLADLGFLIRQGDTLVLDAAVKGGLLTVNGQPIPLPLGF